MSDYTELVKALRHCSKSGVVKCDECEYDGKEWPVGCMEAMMRDAAAAIEELDAEETRLLLLTSDLQDKLMDLQAAQPHWVSVEQPPKKHGKYLVCYVEKGEFYWEEAHYCFYQDGDKWTAWSSYQDDDVEITPDYWMPIEPPEEE